MNWKDDNSVAGFVLQCLSLKEEHNAIFERQAQLNLAWYLGFQYLVWDDSVESLVQMPVREPHRPRLVYNKIMPRVETLVGWMGREKIEFEVRPATDDQADEDVARTGTPVLRYYQDSLHYDHLAERCDRWSLLTGDGFLKVCWDPTKGEMFDAAKMAGMTPAEFRKTYRVDPNLTLGDVDVYSPSPMSVFWGPVGCEFQHADWVIEVNERSVAYVAERYDVDPDELMGDNSKVESAMLYRASDIGPTGVTKKHKADKQACVVAELWARRSAKLPRGRLVTFCNGRVLKNTDNPYEHGQIPIVQFKPIDSPDRPHGACYVDQLIGPQSDYNRSKNQQVENRELMANPFVLYQKGSIQRFDQWNSRPGGMREYVGQAPQVIPGSGMPGITITQEARTEQDMQDIVGVHDASEGQNPTGVRSASAIVALQEKDENRMSTAQRRRRDGHKRVGRLILQTAAQFVREERLIKIIGEDDSTEYIRFRGKDLRGQQQGPGIDYADVQIVTDGMPTTRAAALSTAEMLIRAGALQPAVNKDDRDLLFRLTDIGSPAEIDDSQRDRIQARLENERLSMGEKIEPRDFDDHEQHLREHEMYEKRGFFRDAPPEIQALHLYHRTRHKVLMAKKALEAQVIMQQAMQEMGLNPAPQENANVGAGSNGQPGNQSRQSPGGGQAGPL